MKKRVAISASDFLGLFGLGFAIICRGVCDFLSLEDGREIGPWLR